MARFNDYWTEEEQRAEDLEGQKEYWRAEALQSFYIDAERIAQKVEHLIDDDDLTLHINDIIKVADAIEEVAEMCHSYVYHDDYEFEYDFMKEGKAFITDHFGFTGEE